MSEADYRIGQDIADMRRELASLWERVNGIILPELEPVFAELADLRAQLADHAHDAPAADVEAIAEEAAAEAVAELAAELAEPDPEPAPEPTPDPEPEPETPPRREHVLHRRFGRRD